MNPNDIQIGGDHYNKAGQIQHWDWMIKLKADYFTGCASKYIFRFEDKNGLEDLEKAEHFLDKRAGTWHSVGYRFRLWRHLTDIFRWTEMHTFHPQKHLDNLARKAFMESLYGKTESLVHLIREYRIVIQNYPVNQ